MSEEKKGNVSELKIAPRFATPDMIEMAEQLERLAVMTQEGKVPGVALAWVEEKVAGDIQCVRHFAYEERLSSLTGNTCALLASLTDEMNRD